MLRGSLGSSGVFSSLPAPAAAVDASINSNSAAAASDQVPSRSPVVSGITTAGLVVPFTRSPVPDEDFLHKVRLCFRRVCELITFDRHGSPFIGVRPSVADFAMFVLIKQIQRNDLPHVPPSILDAPEFSPLHDLVDVLTSFPGVRRFYEEEKR